MLFEELPRVWAVTSTKPEVDSAVRKGQQAHKRDGEVEDLREVEQHEFKAVWLNTDPKRNERDEGGEQAVCQAMAEPDGVAGQDL